MTGREEQILKIIMKNPMISQDDIASMLGIARPSVAVHIKHLVEKGYIVGRGYILSEDTEYCLVIGGANIDIIGASSTNLVEKDSNPGEINVSFGGVGRNIACNISALSINTKLMTAIGNDSYGKLISEDCAKSGVNIDHSFTFNGMSTSMYIAILNQNNDMEMAISDMEIIDKLNSDLLKSKKPVLDKASVIVADTNVSTDVLNFLIKGYGDKLYIDPVSTKKALKIVDNLKGIRLLKPNKHEAAVLAGVKIESEKDLISAGEKLVKSGVTQVIISDGERGSYYFDEKRRYHLNASNVKVVSVNGAGDAFLAGFISAYLDGQTLVTQLKMACAASIEVLGSKKSTLEKGIKLKLEKMIGGIKICQV